MAKATTAKNAPAPATPATINSATDALVRESIAAENAAKAAQEAWNAANPILAKVIATIAASDPDAKSVQRMTGSANIAAYVATQDRAWQDKIVNAYNDDDLGLAGAAGMLRNKIRKDRTSWDVDNDPEKRIAALLETTGVKAALTAMNDTIAAEFKDLVTLFGDLKIGLALDVDDNGVYSVKVKHSGRKSSSGATGATGATKESQNRDLAGFIRNHAESITLPNGMKALYVTVRDKNPVSAFLGIDGNMYDIDGNAITHIDGRRIVRHSAKGDTTPDLVSLALWCNSAAFKDGRNGSWNAWRSVKVAKGGKTLDAAYDELDAALYDSNATSSGNDDDNES